MTVAIGLLVVLTLPTWPDRASFLSNEDRDTLQLALTKDTNLAAMDRLDRKALQRCLLDWKTWVMVVIFFGTSSTTYSINIFGYVFSEHCFLLSGSYEVLRPIAKAERVVNMTCD